MLNRFLLVIAVFFVTIGVALAQVDANYGDQAALDGIKGLGPTTSKAIIAERNKGGKFRNWDDLESRVKGMGEKKSVHLSKAGLTVDGKGKPGASFASTSRTTNQARPSTNSSIISGK